MFDVLADRLFFTEREASAVIKEILEAIQYAHKHGVAHRDLKVKFAIFMIARLLNTIFSSQPENVLITQEGKLKIADWGLSKDISAGLSKLATSVGTPECLLIFFFYFLFTKQFIQFRCWYKRFEETFFN